MDHIIVIFHPFEMKQEVMVYQCGECVKHLQPSLEDTVKTVCQLYQQYHTDKIDFCGNPSFINRYIKELKSNYSNMPAIEIIPR